MSFLNLPLPVLLLQLPTSRYVPALLYAFCWPPVCHTDPHSGKSHLHADLYPGLCDSEV